MTDADWIALGKILLAFVPLALVPVLIWIERKGASIIQDRIGPNRAAITLPGIITVRGFGLIHNLTDAVKLFFKESFIPAHAYKWVYVLAPALPVFTAVMAPAVIPFCAPMLWQGGPEGGVSGQILDTDNGILLLFALGALSVYGVVLGSWASNSKYSLLGGLRASAMMVSYEVSMGLGVLGLFLIVGSVSLTEIVQWQEAYAWGVFVQPVGAFLFLVSMFAETNRNPFDVVEGESEIVGGFHTEYSGMKFAMFFMGEYAHMVVASLMMTVLFFGGWDLPFVDTAQLQANPNLALTILLGGAALGAALVAWIIWRNRAVYAKQKASDAARREREYLVVGGGVSLAALVFGAAAVASLFLPIYDVGSVCSALTVGVTQLAITIGKALFFCWLFVWVRWTLPRFRYDQIMTLGWKYLLNIGLINLLLTAVVVALIKEIF